MKDVNSEIDIISSNIVNWEKNISSVAKSLKNKKDIVFNKSDNSHFVEESLFVKVKSLPTYNLTVGGIDGGLLKKEYHGANIIITRAVCAIFKYVNGKLSDSNYLPSAFPTPKIKVLNNVFDGSEFSIVAGFERVKEEIGLACNMLDKNLDILFLDGSLMLHPSLKDKINHSNVFKQGYGEVLNKIKEMYKLALVNKTIVSGIVEDSRSQAFIKNCICDLKLNCFENIESVRDTHFLTYFLSIGERTAIFKIISKDNKTNINSDIKEFENNLFSFYIRPSEFDRALRVDFFAKENPIEIGSKIAEIIYSMSKYNCAYSIPPVIIDADQRAKLSGEELSFVENEIRKRCGNIASFSELRRNFRPV